MIGPAVQAFTEDEARALNIAVIYALRQGLATDERDGRYTNTSMVSAAEKLGIEVKDEWRGD